jgi:NitT/TauT family transport system substrate-binding protein
MGFFHDQAPTIEAKTGKKVSYLLYADWGMNLLGTGLVASDDTITGKADLAKRMVRATRKSWSEAARDIPGAVDAMAAMAEQEPPKEVMTKQLTLATSLLGTPSAPGVNDEAKWNETITLMSKYSGLQAPGAPAAYWNGSFGS